jgi:hypothetical protein
MVRVTAAFPFPIPHFTSSSLAMSKKPPAKRESYNPLLKSFPDSEKINSVSEAAEVLYLRLIAASDDAGRYWAEPKIVLAKLFTHRSVNGQVTARSVDRRLSELAGAGLIRFYDSGGKRYLEMVRVFKRLRPELPMHLLCPEPADQAGERENVLDAEAFRAAVRKIAAVRRLEGPGEDPGFLEKKPADTPHASSQRCHNVGTRSSPSRSTNPTQPYPTQPNPNAAHHASTVATHPTNVDASPSRRCAGIVDSDSNGLTPTVADFAWSKQAASERAAEFEHAVEPALTEASPGPTPPGPFAASPPARSASEFEAFWNAYPFRAGRKTDKQQAWRLFGRLAEVDLPAAIEAARNYARETQATKRIPKDPHNFLTDDYWRSWVGPPAAESSSRYVDPNSEEAQTWSAE